jgi:hypothetical protein
MNSETMSTPVKRNAVDESELVKAPKRRRVSGLMRRTQEELTVGVLSNGNHTNEARIAALQALWAIEPVSDRDELLRTEIWVAIVKTVMCGGEEQLAALRAAACVSGRVRRPVFK